MRLALLAAGVLLLSATAARADEAPAAAALPVAAPLDCQRALALATTALREGGVLDAHLLVSVGRLGCDRFELDAVGAIALARLDEGPRARALLARWQPTESGGAAAIIDAWTLWRERDERAFSLAIARAPASAQLRLRAYASLDRATVESALIGDDAARTEALALLARRAAARQRRPWLAGVLSAAVPGAGQAYAGNWESAAIAFVLNGLAISATVELARRELWLTAGLAGTVASMFYVGNIGSAVDLARRRNATAQAPIEELLRQRLLPEVYP